MSKIKAALLKIKVFHNPERTIQTAIVVSTFLILFVGCSSNYKWSEHYIKRASVANELPAGSTISIINSQPDDEKILIGTFEPTKIYGSLHQLTGAIVEHLSRELKKQKVMVSENAEKSLDIKVIRTSSIGEWAVRVKLDVDIKAGNGYTRSFFAEAVSPMTLTQAFNMAVAEAVTVILNDDKIVAYLQN